MKLIFCRKCQDVFKLGFKVKECQCGRSSGRYLEDGLNADIDGDAIPLGFINSTLIDALKHRPISGIGMRFTAFVIPLKCGTIKAT